MHDADLRQARIIPAYAGSTVIQSEKQSSGADHPRIRGEHAGSRSGPMGGAGSSPHTRGARDLEGDSPTLFADHPRIRGEHGSGPTRRSSSSGSSPHTRGAQSPRHRWSRRGGIIPAYAGSTVLYSRNWTRVQDHPRIRGEHALALLLWRGEAGSSPHTRGAPRAGICMRLSIRIIPAYAGSTCRHQSTNATEADHPRIRGEHASYSPPRNSTIRIIPAYAGSTDGPHTTSNPQWDHPRIRGEHVGEDNPRDYPRGSSPHTRGARSRRLS